VKRAGPVISGRFPRHARRSGAAHWAGSADEHARLRMLADGERGFSAPAVRFDPRGHPAMRFDPLVHPVAITGQCVIGDQLRVPAVWCAMVKCDVAFADPAALGEADNRARALAAGWAEDALARMVCPSCQVTYPVPVWWVLARRPGGGGDHAPARDASWAVGGASQPGWPAVQPMRSAPGGRPPAAGQNRQHRTQWPRMLSALAGPSGNKPRHVHAG
jgi:hypothetical protein